MSNSVGLNLFELIGVAIIS